MKAAQIPCIFLENAVCLLVPNETDNGACLTVTRFPQGHIAQKFRDLTKRSLFCVRSSFEPQAHDSLGISALSGSWESRLADSAPVFPARSSVQWHWQPHIPDRPDAPLQPGPGPSPQARLPVAAAQSWLTSQ